MVIKRSIKFVGIKVWNEIPFDISDLNSVTAKHFQKKFVLHLICGEWINPNAKILDFNNWFRNTNGIKLILLYTGTYQVWFAQLGWFAFHLRFILSVWKIKKKLNCYHHSRVLLNTAKNTREQIYLKIQRFQQQEITKNTREQIYL